jgi:hypothetical protein
MLRFVLGALTGIIAVTYWSGESRNLQGRHMPRLRSKAAERVEIAERAIVSLVQNMSSRARARLGSEASATTAGRASLPKS